MPGCRDCGNTVERDGTGSRRCQACRKATRLRRVVVLDDGIGEQLVCVVCGLAFDFGGREKAHYAARGFTRPRRCAFCRRERRGDLT